MNEELATPDMSATTPPTGDRTGDSFLLAYDELRKAARIQRRLLPMHETLNTTALVHEAFIRLVQGGVLGLRDRAHLMAVAATAMRHYLVDYTRRRSAAKRGGGVRPVRLDSEDYPVAHPEPGALDLDTLLALDDALARLGRDSERQRQVVECRFFGGMSIEETAVALSISPATVKRDWSLAQAWLYRELEPHL